MRKLISKGGIAGPLEGEDHAGESSWRSKGVLEVLACVVEGGREYGEDNSAEEKDKAEKEHDEANEVDKVAA